MGTVDMIKERMNKVKACPICGSAPVLKRDSLDRGNGHGYPGCYDMHYECAGCGIIKGGETTDIYDKPGEPTAEQRAAQDWNEIVDYVNELIENKRKAEGD